MASFYAELHVAGTICRVVHCRFACQQHTDARGRVQAKVHFAPLELTVDVPQGDVLLDWAITPHKPLSGEVVFYDLARQTPYETIAFTGECVRYTEHFASGANGDGAYVCELTIAARSFELRAGGPVENYSASMPTSMQRILPAESIAVSAPAPSATPDAPPVSYLTTGMDPDYEGEETGAVWGTAVKYLSPDERQAYSIHTQADGLVYNAQGQLLDTQAAGTVTSKGKAIFVMAETGEIYVSTEHQAGLFHHSSFLAGAPVAAAGEMRVINGVIESISNRSGHYTPDQSFTHQAVKQLWRSGVKDTDKINIEDFDH